jgi:glycosyltransferase involved in cell wall biosynthesis
MKKNTKKHLLIVSKGGLYTVNNVNQGKYSSLSNWATGDYTHLLLNKEVAKQATESDFALVGCFISDSVLTRVPVISAIYYFIMIVIKVIYRHFSIRKYDCIIARNPIYAGLLSFVIGKLLNIPYIVEFNGNYTHQANWSDHVESAFGRLKKRISENVIPFVCRHSSGIKLLYQGQEALFSDEEHKIKVFHEYVPVTQLETIANINYEIAMDKYILLLGNPWYTKGVDVLINAINHIKKEGEIKMDFNVLIVGWFPFGTKEKMEALIQSNNIHIRDAVDYPEALALIKNSEMLVLPSRTEAMGRVLLEAMAFKRPVIGSKVDGIATYLPDNKAGFLFTSEDVVGLADKIMKVMTNTELKTSMGNYGFDYVSSKLSENIYSEKYREFVSSVCED